MGYTWANLLFLWWATLAFTGGPWGKDYAEECARWAGSDPDCKQHFELHLRGGCRCATTACTATKVDEDTALYRFVPCVPIPGGHVGRRTCKQQLTDEDLSSDERLAKQQLQASITLMNTDPAAAVVTLRSAAALGSVPAQGKLARMYAAGRSEVLGCAFTSSVDANYTEAARYANMAPGESRVACEHLHANVTGMTGVLDALHRSF